ncbi:hypothetical protein Sjap_024243 [Stephania japonica]|uniref:BED-type domain-containing protein n=1 Tax=Stephania japonica TaxID=461633 RepID=A0AAP0HNS3_9MAGN
MTSTCPHSIPTVPTELDLSQGVNPFDIPTPTPQPPPPNETNESSLPSLPPNPGNKRKRTSEAWDYFTIREEEPNKPRAYCKFCPKSYACHSKSCGTKNLILHLEKCSNPNHPWKIENERHPSKQANLCFSSTHDGSSAESTVHLFATTHDYHNCRRLLTRMIILDELPFKFVENDGFRDFIAGLNSKFTVLSRRTITRDCMSLYSIERTKLKKMFRGSSQRLCITTDAWQSIQKIDYMVLTAHFIDSEWKLQKKILNFFQIPNHKGDTIGKAMEKCLLEWGIERVFTVTVDNATSNDVAVFYLARKVRNWGGLVLDGEFFHVRCVAHILNLVVKEGLEELDSSIEKIRYFVRYVRSSSARSLTFKTYVEQEKLNTNGGICLDVSTRWNSTFLMLDAALTYQRAFVRMEGEGDDLNLEKIPSDDDWEKVKMFVKFLKSFYEITKRVSVFLHVTSNRYFQEIYLVHGIIQKYCESNNVYLSSMARRMKVKFDKYWGNTEKTNVMLYVPVLLDPRFKLKPLSYCFNLMYGKEVGEVMTKKVDTTFRRLYEAYKAFSSKDDDNDSEDERTPNPINLELDDIPQFGQIT